MQVVEQTQQEIPKEQGCHALYMLDAVLCLKVNFTDVWRGLQETLAELKLMRDKPGPKFAEFLVSGGIMDSLKVGVLSESAVIRFVFVEEFEDGTDIYDRF